MYSFIPDPSPFLGYWLQGGAQWRWMRECLSKSLHVPLYLWLHTKKQQQKKIHYSPFGMAHSLLIHQCSLVINYVVPRGSSVLFFFLAQKPAVWALLTGSTSDGFHPCFAQITHTLNLCKEAITLLPHRSCISSCSLCKAFRMTYKAEYSVKHRDYYHHCSRHERYEEATCRRAGFFS